MRTFWCVKNAVGHWYSGSSNPAQARMWNVHPRSRTELEKQVACDLAEDVGGEVWEFTITEKRLEAAA